MADRWPYAKFSLGDRFMVLRSSRIPTQQGFTLLELMAVIFIAGIMASLIMMSVGGNSEREFRRDANRLQQALNMAADEAQFNGQDLGFWLAPDGSSYSFYTFDNKALAWTAYDKQGFTSYKLPTRYAMDVSLLGEPVDLAALYKKTYKLNNFKAEKFDEAPIQPLLVFFSDGNYSAFRLRLSNPNINGVYYNLEGDGLGSITLDKTEARQKPRTRRG